MEQIKEELITFASKAWLFCLYIVVGIIGKFSHDFIMGKRLSWTQVLASIGIALFCGFLASMVCYNKFPEYAAYIVPIATLLSEKLVIALLSVDYKKLAAEIAAYWANRLGK